MSPASRSPILGLKSNSPGGTSGIEASNCQSQASCWLPSKTRFASSTLCFLLQDVRTGCWILSWRFTALGLWQLRITALVNLCWCLRRGYALQAIQIGELGVVKWVFGLYIRGLWRALLTRQPALLFYLFRSKDWLLAVPRLLPWQPCVLTILTQRMSAACVVFPFLP